MSVIKNLLINERPREKLIHNGPENITDTELLAIILRTGGNNMSSVELSRTLLKDFGSLGGVLNADVEKLKAFHNLGFSKAVTIKAVKEISLRYLSFSKTFNQTIYSPSDVYDLIISSVFDKPKEYFYVLSLNSKNELISKDLISIGNTMQNLVFTGEILKTALSKNALYIILVHNHISNDPSPSKEDIINTNKIYRSARLIGINLLDHIIVTNKSFISMKALDLIKSKNLNIRKEVKKC